MTRKKRTSFDKLRIFASQIKDHRLAVRVRAMIACITREDLDIALALGEAKDHGKHQSVTAESLAVLVKFLALSKNFKKARIIAKEDMREMNTYWHAQAWIFLAKASDNEEDKREAEKIIGRIVDTEHHNQAKIDLATPSKSFVSEEFSFDIVDKIASVLNQLDDFLDGHKICPKNNSAYLHAQAELVLAMFFAEALK